MMKEQPSMPTSLDTIIELTDQELESMRGGCHHRHDFDDDDDGRGRRFGERFDHDIEGTVFIQESIRFSFRRW